jgi:hypothetical protein
MLFFLMKFWLTNIELVFMAKRSEDALASAFY